MESVAPWGMGMGVVDQYAPHKYSPHPSRQSNRHSRVESADSSDPIPPILIAATVQTNQPRTKRVRKWLLAWYCSYARQAHQGIRLLRIIIIMCEIFQKLLPSRSNKELIWCASIGLVVIFYACHPPKDTHVIYFVNGKV